MVFEFLQEFADVVAIRLAEFRVSLGEVTYFSGDDVPPIGLEPSGNGMDRSPLRDEARAGVPLGDIVILRMAERLKIVGAGFNRDGFEIDRGVGVVRFDETYMVEQKLVAVGGTQNTGLEKVTDFGGCALVIVGIDFDNDGHLVGRIAFEHQVLEGRLVTACSGALGDGTLDGFTGDVGLARLFQDREEPSIAGGITAAEFGCDRDFFNEFSDDLTFFEVHDRAFRVEPLTSHMTAACVANGRG